MKECQLNKHLFLNADFVSLFFCYEQQRKSQLMLGWGILVTETGASTHLACLAKISTESSIIFVVKSVLLADLSG